MAGRLIICAGPIGNLGDAPPRLAEALGGADLVYAEDTRRARILLDRLGVATPVRSYFVGNEAARGEELAGHLAAGETVALLSDAGTPSISDPGLTAVRVAVAAGAEVTGIPGPSAVTMALALSGLPADRFVFEGFLPRRGRRRSDILEALAVEERTVVLFAAPGRLAADLLDLAAALGPHRSAVVCRELTKVHEELWRGTLGAAAEHWTATRVRGEVTVVIGGADRRQPDAGEAVQAVQGLVEHGMSVSRAVRRVAEETGVSRRSLYELVVTPGDEAGD